MVTFIFMPGERPLVVSTALMLCRTTSAVLFCTDSFIFSSTACDSITGIGGNPEVPGPDVCELETEVLWTWLSDDGWGSDMFHEDPGNTQASPFKKVANLRAHTVNQCKLFNAF